MFSWYISIEITTKYTIIIFMPSSYFIKSKSKLMKYWKLNMQTACNESQRESSTCILFSVSNHFYIFVIACATILWTCTKMNSFLRIISYISYHIKSDNVVFISYLPIIFKRTSISTFRWHLLILKVFTMKV